MKYFDIYIGLIFIVKIIFLFLSAYYMYLKGINHIKSNAHTKEKENVKEKENIKEKEKNIEITKKILEFIFTILMSLLLIYLFNPRYKKDIKLDYETNLLLFLFGFILLISADWGLFKQHVGYIKKHALKK